MLEYLEPYALQCDLLKLKAIKAERDAALRRESALHYTNLLESLPHLAPSTLSLSKSSVTIGDKSDLINTSFDPEKIAKKLIPWRKGPFTLFGTEIDSEWRSDLKWDRLENELDLTNKMILDIGCNNGYYMFRMAAKGPKLVLGIDPFLHYHIQFQMLNHFASLKNIHHELFGHEHLHYFKGMFDLIFSMGVLYHHKHPLKQLSDIYEALRPGGTLLLETMGIAGEESMALFPEGRYAQMRNVFFVPTLSCLINWLKRANFSEINVLSDVLLTTEEQRQTPYCPDPFFSLEKFLDKNDPSKTVEGYPAPRRFMIKVTRGS